MGLHEVGEWGVSEVLWRGVVCLGGVGACLLLGSVAVRVFVCWLNRDLANEKETNYERW